MLSEKHINDGDFNDASKKCTTQKMILLKSIRSWYHGTHYFSRAFSTANRLAVLMKKVLNQCFQAGINISTIVCDMDEVNWRVLSVLGANMQQPHFTFHNKEIVTLFDKPHLLKRF
ncbi:unnamed protein product [Parnassius mnemosyne]|uniref:Transposable element P transposase-like RNase H domain-containing protein n=1 Tax=Parnassius mnemosyne TaxID=213953 RepID=A0AAV1KYI2_9NEOP